MTDTEIDRKILGDFFILIELRFFYYKKGGFIYQFSLLNLTLITQ